MALRIEIQSVIPDTRATVKKNYLNSLGLKKAIKELWISDIYTIDKDFSKEELEKIGSILSNPITQSFVISSEAKRSREISPTFSYALEIGYLPGVTDNIANTARESIEDLLKIKFAPEENLYTSQLLLVNGEFTEKELQQITVNLYNPLIQRLHIKTASQYKKEKGMDIIIPKVILQEQPKVTTVNLDIPDQDLVIIGKLGIANEDGTRRGPLALDLAFMKTIQSYFKKLGRQPTDLELESIAQTWSEHCKHTIFADPMDEIKDGLYKTYIKKATEDIRKKRAKSSQPPLVKGEPKAGDFCISVFTDNSGAIAFDKKYMVTHKVETHNTPSALDPFGGSITGIVGVNRDTIGFGMGAKPIANFYGFCFADPKKDIPLYKDKNKTIKMLSSRRIMDGIIAGINTGGNQSGIPTPQGFVYFDERYRGKPLVFAGTVGIMPRKIKGKLSHLKQAKPGDLIIMIGGRVGKDGIHGATFSSEALTSGSPATAVQIGDPITQKKLSDAIVKEARDLLIYNSITDNGAGGLSCSVAEMAKESNGCVVQLEKVPLKYPGLDPWEIWISESQERMTVAVPKKNWKKFLDLMNRRGVEATIIGEFTKSGKCIVTYNKKTVMDVDMDFLHDGLPQRQMTTAYVQPLYEETVIPEEKEYDTTLKTMLQRLNITSFEFISQQYDHIVQGNAVLGPLQGSGRVNANTSVIRPLLNSQKGVVLSHSLYPTYSEINPYNMAASAIDTAIRNAVAAGANPAYLSLLDNFCWCSSEEPERLGQLKLAAKACYDYAVSYETPYISGKDSMFNDFKGFDEKGEALKISVLPTLLISSFGVIDDITKVVSLDAKIPGDLVYILGETSEELAGSEYFSLLSEKNKKEILSNAVPTVDAKKNEKVYTDVYAAIQKNLIASSISLERGGLAVALSKKAIGGQLGLTIEVSKLPGKWSRDDFALYSESQGRILVTVAPENKKAFEKSMSGNAFAEIGKVTQDPVIKIKGKNGKTIIDVTLTELTNSYRETFEDF